MDANSETLNVFVQTARYARFLIDDPLSRIATSVPSNARDRPQFQEVAEECEDLVVSIKCLLRKLENPQNGAKGGGDGRPRPLAKNGFHGSRSSSPACSRPRSLSLLSLTNGNERRLGGEATGFKRGPGSFQGSFREKKFQPKFGGHSPSNSQSLDGNGQKITYKFQDENVEIHEKFVTLCEQLNSKKSSCGYYCRPCFMFCPNVKEWDEHLSSRMHSTIFLKSCKNIMSSCNKCPVKVIATSLLATAYIRYHLQENHPEVRQSEYFNFYELENVDRKPPKSHADHKQPPTARQPRQPYQKKPASNSTPAVKSSTGGKSSPPLNKPSAPQPDGFKELLIYVIDKKKEDIGPDNQPFHGICLICCKVIEDVYDFMKHQMEHGDQVRTSDCDTCNLSICGFGDNVCRLLDIPEHVELDKCVG